MEKAERQGEPTRLGSYEIVRKLARGGMADLFLARTVTHTFERLVVLKKILPKFAANPRYVQLFLDEAKLAAGLNHKNIVQVFDIGNHGADSFFAMEFLHGQDVRTVLHRAWRLNEKMPIKHAIHVASQVAAALHFAHEKRKPDGSLLNIVHRDVSPSNVIVTYDGAVKLLDFGVAKAATSTIKTRTGTLKGKISYMSPEQAKGGSVDRRSDIFSLGIVLWEMITTTRLFRGENDLATLQLIINQAPRKPSEVNPECPKELERIVLRALAQDPAARYQTGHELAVELEDLVRQLQLVQSTTALSLYMATLFRSEIASWHEAKAAGVELSEHLTNASAAAEGTTPISESEFIEPLNEEEEDELELEDEEPETLRPVAGVIDPSINPMRASKPVLRAPPTATPPPSAVVRAATAPPIPRREGGTPAPVIEHRGSGPVRVQVREGTPPPVIERRPSSTGSVPVIPAPSAGSPTPPPMQRLDVTPLPSVMLGRIDPTVSKTPAPPAPEIPAWPSAAEAVALPGQLFSPEHASRIRKHAMMGGGALFGLILLISIIKGCGSSAPEAKSVKPAVAEPAEPAEPVTQEPVEPEPTPVEVPAVTVDAGVVEPPVDASEPAVVPPIDAAVADVAPVEPPVIKKKPVVKKPPTGTKKDPKQPKGFDPNRPLPRR